MPTHLPRSRDVNGRVFLLLSIESVVIERVAGFAVATVVAAVLASMVVLFAVSLRWFE
ncbi:hypothetical protein [Natronobacterium gregoryi]|uniref:hypothetical protein n=1 Tax=Natronobacterium gregoryi TaxID=44930 RepID=UPI0012DC2EAD|nr:hypothetical protein [Natronobacterium gregoryi]